MRVAIVGEYVVDSLEWHLCDSFRHLGHDVSAFGQFSTKPTVKKVQFWLSHFVAPYELGLNRRMADRIVAYGPDLVVVVTRMIHPSAIAAIKKKLPGRAVIHVNPDALTNLHRQQIIASDYDFYFTKEPYLAAIFRDKLGLNAHYVPEGFNPRVNIRPDVPKPDAEAITDVDVLMYGGLYAYRVRMAERLLKAGIRLHIYGSPSHYPSALVNAAFRRRILVGEEKNSLLYGAKIVFNNLHYAEVSSANQKYFEINGTGAFQLCDHKPTLHEYSGVPIDKVTFTTIDDAIDRIRYYLSRPAERHALAAQQYQHFMKHHTFDQRVEQILRIVAAQ